LLFNTVLIISICSSVYPYILASHLRPALCIPMWQLPSGMLQIWSHKLHKNKINHTEFHRKQEWLLCTASTDQYVCLWDIRMLKNRDSYLAQLKHEKGINSGQ